MSKTYKLSRLFLLVLIISVSAITHGCVNSNRPNVSVQSHNKTTNYTEYLTVLDEIHAKYVRHGSSYLPYHLFDLTGDGVYELLVKTGTCEADYLWEVYTIADNNTKYLGCFNGGTHSGLFASDEGVLYCRAGQMDWEMISQIRFVNGVIEEAVYNSNWNTYDQRMSLNYLPSSRITDYDEIFDKQWKHLAVSDTNNNDTDVATMLGNWYSNPYDDSYLIDDIYRNMVIFNSDMTFHLRVNLLEGMGNMFGSYKISNNVIYLHVTSRDFIGYRNDDMERCIFTVKDGKLQYKGNFIGNMENDHIFLRDE